MLLKCHTGSGSGGPGFGLGIVLVCRFGFWHQCLIDHTLYVTYTEDLVRSVGTELLPVLVLVPIPVPVPVPFFFFSFFFSNMFVFYAYLCAMFNTRVLVNKIVVVFMGSSVLLNVHEWTHNTTILL